MPTRGSGFRVDRVYTDVDGQTREAERHDVRTSTPMPILRRVVVVDVFYDPVVQLTEDVIARLEEDVQNPEQVSNITRNCIVARPISSGISRLDTRSSVYFPLFGPYMSMPIKPGEQAYVIYEDPAVSADVGLWVCRIPEPMAVDDVNYTHGDRRYALDTVARDAVDKLEGAEDPSAPPGFPNGNPSLDSLTIGQSSDEYDRIVERATASAQFVPEPVPRFTSRPGDYVIQGSNNTLLSLGTTRLSSATNEDEVEEASGTVVVVCGRGVGDDTAPPTVENERGDDEVDKAPHLRDVEANPREGDFDFVNDSSVMMVSMNADVDGMFEVNIPNGGEATPGTAPSIGVRTDRLRLLAREDVKIQAGENGTGAAIVLDANGDITLIPGPGGVIRLGGADATHAVLGNLGQAAAGTVVGQPILTTMGGVAGTPADDPHGKFSTKVLFKV